MRLGERLLDQLIKSLTSPMAYVLIGSLLAFTLFGLPRVDASVFNRAAMLSNGLKGSLTAVALLSFAPKGYSLPLPLYHQPKRCAQYGMSSLDYAQIKPICQRAPITS